MDNPKTTLSARFLTDFFIILGFDTTLRVYSTTGLNMRRLFLLLSFLLTARLFASPVNQLQEYTLENGMQVFLLEDSTDAQVHIEYSCRAGFSSQTQSKNGFF